MNKLKLAPSDCPICAKSIEFVSTDDFWSCRDGLRSIDCPLGNCVTRERALCTVLFELIPRYSIIDKTIYESSPVMRGLSAWLKKNCSAYVPTGFYPKAPFGTAVNGIRNENLEHLTLDDKSVDIWIHLDVLEHLFNPFQALREISRSLKSGGVCLFTAPTYPDRLKSEQVAWLLPDGSTKINGKPEFHGNPQNPEQGALVTWRYGYDLPLLIQRETDLDVEVRRWQSRHIGVMGTMTEVYICKKL